MQMMARDVYNRNRFDIGGRSVGFDVAWIL